MLFHLRVSSTVFPYIHDFFQHDKSNLLPNNTCTYKKERKSSPPCCFNNQSLVLLIFPFLSAEFFINGWMEFSENFKDDREYKYLKKFILHFFKINFWSFVSYSETKKNLSPWDLKNGKNLSIQTLWGDRPVYIRT